jgi:hypothetical protein
MRPRSRRGNLVIARTREVPIHRQPLGRFGRFTRRRRFGLVRTGGLLGLIAAIRLTQAMRPRWRLVGAVAGFLIEVVGFNVFSGGMQVASSLAGMGLLLLALMKDASQCSPRQVGIPTAARPPC